MHSGICDADALATLVGKLPRFGVLGGCWGVVWGLFGAVGGCLGLLGVFGYARLARYMAYGVKFAFF